MTVACAGAGGFIGGHLVADLVRQGADVVAIDSKPFDEWFQRSDQAENIRADLSNLEACQEAIAGCSDVYNMAADMGGMGFISQYKAACMLSVLPSTNLLLAARDVGARRFFFASSACVYPDYRQDVPDLAPLKEEDAYPAMPEDGYGWEKLFSERMATHFWEDYGLITRIARYHNVYGPHGCYDGGREKAPAAICRKVAEAVLTGRHEIEIWGDGQQTRSFTFIDDCIRGTQLLMYSPVKEPLNIGSDRMVTINELVDIVVDIAGVKLKRIHVDGPQGVRGRNSDNTLCRERLGWEPRVSLEEGMADTYQWIHDQVFAPR